MRLFVDLDNLIITRQALVSSAITDSTVPRANVSLTVQFFQQGEIVDPEVSTRDIAWANVDDPGEIETSEANGFEDGDEVAIDGVTGQPTIISSASVHASATVITANNTATSPGAGHGLTSGDEVTIADHPTSDAASATIISSSVAASTEVLTDTPHGLISGDSVTIAGHTGAPRDITSATFAVRTGTAEADDELITSTAHGFTAGQTVVFTSLTGGTGLTAGTTYYVIAGGLTADKFAVSATSGGSAVNITVDYSALTVINTAAAILTCPAHGLSSSDVVTIEDHSVGDNLVYAISSSSTANPTVITVSQAHELLTGDSVVIAGHTSTPSINGTWAITVLTSTTFTIPVNVSAGGGALGTVTRSVVNLNGSRTVTVVDSSTFTVPVPTNTRTTGGTVTRTISTPTINGTRIVTVTSPTTFTVPVTVTAGGVGGTVDRAAVDLNGRRIVTVLSSSTFSIPVANPTLSVGGTVTRDTATPDVNGPQTVSNIVDDYKFNIASVVITHRGVGGTVSKTTPLNLRWTVKEEDKFDQDPALALANDFVKSGTGDTLAFKGSVNYITNALNALLGIEASVALTATITLGSPPNKTVVTATHGFATGDEVVFTTTGALPTGITSGITYFVIAEGLTSTNFEIALTAGGSAILFTGSQSGVHTVTKCHTTDDVEEVTTMAELSWAGEHPGKTNWITHAIRNDLYKSGDTSPVSTGGTAGKSAIGITDSTVTEVFATPLATANWHFLGSPVVSNTVDVSPLGIFPVILTERSTTGFTYALSAATDSDNYVFEYVIALD